MLWWWDPAPLYYLRTVCNRSEWASEKTCSRQCLCVCSAEDRSCGSTGAGRAQTETGTLWYTGGSGTSGAPGENGYAQGRALASGRSGSMPSPHTCTPAWRLYTYAQSAPELLAPLEYFRNENRNTAGVGPVIGRTPGIMNSKMKV